MVSFGSQLRLARRPGWEEAYFDYEALKLLLTQIEAIYEEAHLHERGRDSRDLDVMFPETPLVSGEPAENTDFRDQLFNESDSDAAFESLMKYDYLSAEEEKAVELEQQQHQLELEQATMMNPIVSPSNKNGNISGSGSSDMQIFSTSQNHRPDIITATSSTSTHPFSMGSYSHDPSNDFHAYGVEDFDEEDSQDGHNNCVPATWGVGRSQPKKMSRQQKPPFRGKGRGNHFVSPSGDSDFFVHQSINNTNTRDAFILDRSESDVQFNDEENEAEVQTRSLDGMQTFPSFSRSNPNSILKKPFRSTTTNEKTSLLSGVQTTTTGGSSMFSFASQTGPMTPPASDTFIVANNSQNMRQLQLPNIGLGNTNKAMSTSYHTKNKAEMAQKLEKERKEERRKRRQQRRKRDEQRKKLEKKVPPHIRIAHTKAREITQRFLGLLRAECEKVMLFAQARLGELADTVGSLRFPSEEDQHPASVAHYHDPTITSQHSESAPLSPRSQGSFDYPLSDGGMHSSASSTSDDGSGGELFYWSDSSSESIRSRESGSPHVRKQFSAFRAENVAKRAKESPQVEVKRPPRPAKKHDGFDSTKRHLDHFEKLRKSRPVFQRSGNVVGEDLLLLSAVDEADGFTAVGVELMHVLRFICVNLVAVRRICMKHDRLLMNRMLGGYYQHLKMLAAAEENNNLVGRGLNGTQGRGPNLQSYMLARESDDIFEPTHPAVIGQTNNNHKLVGLYDANLQQLANSRTVQVISSCLVLALSDFEDSRSRANAYTSTKSVPAAQRTSGIRVMIPRRQQRDQMSVLTGSDSQPPASGFTLDEIEEYDYDSDGDDGPLSTASSVSLVRLRFTVTNIIALRASAQKKKDMYSTYLSRSMLAFTGKAVIGEGLDGCSRETLNFFVSYDPDAALLMDPASLNEGLQQGAWSKRSLTAVMASSLAVATTPVEVPHDISIKSLHKQEQTVIRALNVLPKVKMFSAPDLFKSRRVKKSRSQSVDDSFVSILRLNRISHLLYNMNYFVVHPTTISFVKAIGSPGAHSALIIGAPNVGALLAALLHCYILSGDSKEPLSSVSSYRWLFVLAALLGVTGNGVMVLAFWKGSASLAVLGRLIFGFSCSEILHRNIVASLLPNNRIVFETAMLVQAQVLGFLLGMVVGTLAEYLPYHVKGWGVRSLSSSSWFLAGLWFFHLCSVCLFFRVEDGDAKERMEAKNSAEVEQLLARYKPITSTQDDSISSESGKDNSSSHIRSSLKLAYGTLGQEKTPTKVEHRDTEAYLSTKQKEKRKRRGRSRKRRLRTLKSFPSRLRRLLSYSVAVPVCLGILLYIKIAQEILITSSPMVLNRYFRWGSGRAGILLSILATTILPLHFVCGHVARKYEERVVIKKSLIVLGIGLIAMLNYSSVFRLALQIENLFTLEDQKRDSRQYDWLLGILQYFVGFVIAFIGLTALDCSTLSLLSKVSPPRIRSSSVALQLGTIVSFVSLAARIVADCHILVVGLSHRLINTDLINSLMMPLLAACIIIAIFVRKHFFFLM